MIAYYIVRSEVCLILLHSFMQKNETFIDLEN